MYPQEPSKIIYNNIRYLCESKGIQINELESVVNTSPGYLSRTGTGKKFMSIDIACRVAEYFGITLEKLLSDDFHNELIQMKINDLQAEIKKLESEMK